MITFSDIEAARARVADRVFLSPLAASDTLSKLTGARLSLKLENLQMTGSFKERGACNKLLSLGADERARGVVTASAGNHAQGVAYNAARLGVDSVVVMPEATPLIKVQSAQALGAKVRLVGAGYDDAAEEALAIAERDGRVFVHPFDDELIMAGQGTIGLELLEQNPYLDAVVVSIGGGGLAAGVAVALKETNPKIKVYGVQARAMPSMKHALSGDPTLATTSRTIADGIAVKRPGALTREVIERYVDDIVLVEEEEIAEAILVLLEREKTVAEGAGAAPLAALMNRRLPVEGRRVACVVSGGNIDVNFMSRIIERGLVHRGRLMRLRVRLPDVAGALASLLSVVADSRANVVEVHHDRAFGTELGETWVELVLETRGFDHVEDVKAALGAAGAKLEASVARG
ncbi:MAG: threonine ammonia-lyase [Polyangiaceae bacterium]|nr:threonine ammonia-lyase [Polyangiaceae bacterium]